MHRYYRRRSRLTRSRSEDAYGFASPFGSKQTRPRLRLRRVKRGCCNEDAASVRVAHANRKRRRSTKGSRTGRSGAWTRASYRRLKEVAAVGLSGPAAATGRAGGSGRPVPAAAAPSEPVCRSADRKRLAVARAGPRILLSQTRRLMVYHKVVTPACRSSAKWWMDFPKFSSSEVEEAGRETGCAGEPA